MRRLKPWLEIEIFLVLVCPARMLQARPGGEEELGRLAQKKIREYFLLLESVTRMVEYMVQLLAWLAQLAQSHSCGLRDETKSQAPPPEMISPMLQSQAGLEAQLQPPSTYKTKRGSAPAYSLGAPRHGGEQNLSQAERNQTQGVKLEKPGSCRALGWR